MVLSAAILDRSGMNLAWAAAGALLGLPGGTILRVRAWRLCVPAGDPERSCCASCLTPLPFWPALRCAHCGAWLGAPFVNEAGTAAVLALLLGRLAGRPEVAAFGYLGVLGVALALVDGEVQRLPDPLTIPAYPAVGALLALSAAAGQDSAGLARSALGGVALAGGFLLLGLASAGRVGGGDVKLAGVIGLALGWAGWRTLLAGAFLGFLAAAVVGLALLAARRATRRSMISFGPYLLGGALLAVLASGL